MRLVTDTSMLLRLVMRRLARHPVYGRYLALRAPIKAVDARTCARRALLTMFISFTPNTIVVAFDQDQEYVLVHQLARPRREPPVPVWF